MMTWSAPVVTSTPAENVPVPESPDSETAFSTGRGPGALWS